MSFDDTRQPSKEQNCPWWMELPGITPGTAAILVRYCHFAGSVFFGAMTYIGNAPNFMVKSIADNAVSLDAFILRGYIVYYSLPFCQHLC